MFSCSGPAGCTGGPIIQTSEIWANVGFDDSDSNTSVNGKSIGVLDVLPVIDSAFRELLEVHLAQIAPCLFLPGYLEV